MADTVRALSALQALIPDNTSKATSAQDLRDWLVSSVGKRYYRAVSSTGNLDTDDVIVLATGGAGGITLTLPAVASSDYVYLRVMKVDAGAGAVTLDGDGSEEINGSTTYALSNQWDWVEVLCDGSDWFAFAGG